MVEETQKLTFGYICGWFFGIIFLLITLGALISFKILTAIILFIVSIVLLPPFSNYLKEKKKIELSGGFKVGFVLLCLFLFWATSSFTEKYWTATDYINTPSTSADDINKIYNSKSNVKNCLEIVSKSDKVIDYGWIELVGEIENKCAVKKSYIKVTASYYDEGGIIIGTDFTFVDGMDIPPNSKRPFKLTITDETVIHKVKKYNLQIT